MFKLILGQRRLKLATIFIVVAIALFTLTQPTMAHHAIGGQTPSNFWEGFLSGLAHPVIGLDHFAFVVATGAIAAGIDGGISIPFVFILATLVGTGIHLQAVDLPFSEVVIAASVVLFGLLLAQRNTRVHPPQFYGIALTALAALAGIFHGYAYGESIVGANMMPLVAYLAGFAIIQLIVAILSRAIAKVVLEKFAERMPILRMLGLAIGAIGIVFLTA
jgi:urease accessory protein